MPEGFGGSGSGCCEQKALTAFHGPVLESQVPLIQMEISPNVLILPERKAGIMVGL